MSDEIPCGSQDVSRTKRPMKRRAAPAMPDIQVLPAELSGSSSSSASHRTPPPGQMEYVKPATSRSTLYPSDASDLLAGNMDFASVPAEDAFAIPKSPSKSPTNMFQNLKNCACHCLGIGTTSDEPRTSAISSAEQVEEDFSFFRSEATEKARITLRDVPHSPDAEQAAVQRFAVNAEILTHYYGSAVTPEMAFLVAAKKVKGLSAELTAKLGTLVKMRRCRQMHGDANCSTWCAECGICPHMYKCSCRAKYMGGAWCSHLHLMHRLTKGGAYGRTAYLFVHEDWNHTMMRHMRAFVQGADTMVRVKRDVFEARNTGLRGMPAYKVKICRHETACKCREDRVCALCGACRCRYLCQCEDFWHYGQLCEHAHSVAMIRGRSESEKYEMFNKFVEYEAKWWHTRDAAANADNNRRFYTEEEHDMSYCLGDVVQISAASAFDNNEGSRWLVYARNGKNVHEVVSMDRDKCYCDTFLETSANTCARCAMCANHYSCSCAAADYLICRHQHAVRRHETRMVDDPDAVAEYLNRIAPTVEYTADEISASVVKPWVDDESVDTDDTMNIEDELDTESE